MTRERIEQLSAAVEAMPDGPSRRRFSALLAELTDVASSGGPPPQVVDTTVGSGLTAAPDHRDSGDGLSGMVPPVPPAPPADPADPAGPADGPKKRRWRRSS